MQQYPTWARAHIRCSCIHVEAVAARRYLYPDMRAQSGARKRLPFVASVSTFVTRHARKGAKIRFAGLYDDSSGRHHEQRLAELYGSRPDNEPRRGMGVQLLLTAPPQLP